VSRRKLQSYSHSASRFTRGEGALQDYSTAHANIYDSFLGYNNLYMHITSIRKDNWFHLPLHLS